MSLKYPRRKKRQINGETFSLIPPNEMRSKIMSNIPSKKTSIERILCEQLRKNRLKYRSGKNIFGKPDFIIYGYKIAVFCDGDFWHGYDFKKKSIKTNSSFWDAKIKRNIERDKEVNDELEGKGWVVIRFWEHEIKKQPDECCLKIKRTIHELTKN